MEDHQQEGTTTIIGYPVYPDEKQHIILLPVSMPPLPPPTTTYHYLRDSTIHIPKPENNKERKPTSEELDEGFAVVVLLGYLIVASCILLLLSFIVQPLLHPPPIEVVSLSVDNFNISNSSHLTTKFNVTFSIENPDYGSTVQYFSHVNASVFYKGNSISSTLMEPFFGAGENDRKLVQANFGVFSVYINGSIAEDLVAEWSSGAVNFNVTVDAIFTVDPGTPSEETIVMSSSCQGIRVDTESASGAIMGGSTKCKSKRVH